MRLGSHNIIIYVPRYFYSKDTKGEGSKKNQAGIDVVLDELISYSRIGFFIQV